MAVEIEQQIPSFYNYNYMNCKQIYFYQQEIKFCFWKNNPLKNTHFCDILLT